MVNTLGKTRKQIAKKRGTNNLVLHEKSRNTLRLHKAHVRDQKLEKLASARSKKEQPIADRVAYFQVNVKENGGEPLDIAAVQELIEGYITFTEEEHAEAKKERRPGRPASAKEDMLKMRLDTLKKEHQQGFSLPDVTTSEGISSLLLWEGNWSYLSNLPWVKVTKAGELRKSEFPSKGLI
ncbi:translation machinery-associated protein 16 domain-containing protein [Sarocladium implicatum]|nr:translation machinery-associated protein 16 domain-containing protein [Sarocladium implicatum]